ncbi:hypothetical protein KUCAC02_020538, partial [Chaenocephalus aceratus]
CRDTSEEQIECSESCRYVEICVCAEACDLRPLTFCGSLLSNTTDPESVGEETPPVWSQLFPFISLADIYILIESRCAAKLKSLSNWSSFQKRAVTELKCERMEDDRQAEPLTS